MGQSTVLSRIATNEKFMALTFDDGSDSANTLAILNILETYNVKSTFFLTGMSAEFYPASANQILEHGHEIGNHSYSHPDFIELTADEMKVEIEKCANEILYATNTTVKPLFRPPYGSYNSTVLNVAGSLGYPWTLMWTIDTIDWDGTPADTMISKVLNNAVPGAIVLMHVGSGTHTPEALPEIIEGLKAQGYTLTTISTMLTLTQTTNHPLLKIGSTGEAVSYLQQSLIKLGYNPGPVDGIFGNGTDAAVRAFQASKGLVVDGIVGNNTWAAIDSALANPPTPPAPPQTTHPLLKKGSTGEAVIYLQQSLAKLGYIPGTIDGIFGVNTEAAVKMFQSGNGLVVDGIVGNNTWAAIDKALSNPSTPPTPPTPPPTTHPLVKMGSTGDAVKYLQQSLTKVGYNPGPIDGIFGSKTEAAVKAFQSANGLVVDGIVGAKTWAAIDNALLSPSKSTNSLLENIAANPPKSTNSKINSNLQTPTKQVSPELNNNIQTKPKLSNPLANSVLNLLKFILENKDTFFK